MPAFCDGRATLPALMSTILNTMSSNILLAILPIANQTASEAANLVEPIEPESSLDNISDQMIIPKVASQDMFLVSKTKRIEVLLVLHMGTKAIDQILDVASRRAIHDANYSHVDRLMRVLE